jgi:geranylgeranyl diphosphate synthase type II
MLSEIDVTDPYAPDWARFPMKSDFFPEYRALVDAELERLLPPADPTDPGRLSEAMRYSVLGGGKRLRPILTMLACEACGGEARTALPGAVAVVLVGDALLTLAFDVLADPPDRVERLRALAELTRLAGWKGLVGGQSLDLALCEAEPDTFGELERVHLGKTAALFKASAAMGGLLTGAAQDQVDRLRQYGEQMGLAFQHIDDALDREHARYGDQAADRAGSLLSASRKTADSFGENGKGLLALVDVFEKRLKKTKGD